MCSGRESGQLLLDLAARAAAGTPSGNNKTAAPANLDPLQEAAAGRQGQGQAAAVGGCGNAGQ